MRFELLTGAALPDEPSAADDEMLAQAQGGQRALACLREPMQALVMPRSYRRYPRLEAAMCASAQAGWPAFLRRSGGGLVPQGPGTLALSLVYPMMGQVGDGAEAVYSHLCGILARVLASLGVRTVASAVEGSFCDGRYNLAFTAGGQPRKMVGTAQYWRHLPSTGTPENFLILSHAILLVEADLEMLNQQANRFESSLGSGRAYQADRLISLARAAHEMTMTEPLQGWMAAASTALQKEVLASPPPHTPGSGPVPTGTR